MLAVKGNQEHSEEDVIAAFEAVDDGRSGEKSLAHTEHAKGYGRVETRRTQVLAVPPTLRHLGAWQDITSITRRTRTDTEKSAEKTEARYFISSLSPHVKKMARAMRDHWGSRTGCIACWTCTSRKTEIVRGWATPPPT